MMRLNWAPIPALAAGFLLAGCQATSAPDALRLPPTLAAGNSETMADAATAEVDAAARTASVVAPSNVVGRYEPPRKGTVFTFRNNWSTLPPVISYKVVGVVKAGEVEYLKLTSVAGLKENVSAYYDISGFALKGYRDAGGKAMVTFKPVEERYRFPMKPGDKWLTEWKSFDHNKKAETSGGGVVEVVGFEMLQLPAGTYRTVRVKLPTPRGMPAGMRHYVWFAPELGVTVKEQVGNGSMNWTQILERVDLPAS